MDDFIDDDDGFGDLYIDVDVLASSAINATEGSVQFHPKNDNIHDNAIENSDHDPSDEPSNAGYSKFGNAMEKVEAMADLEGEEEGWRSSESEDDLNILLNDDFDDDLEINSKVDDVNYNNNSNKGLCFDGVGNEEGNERYNNEKDLALRGGEGGENGKSVVGGCNSKCKNMKFHTPAFPSNFKGNGSAGVASYSSMSVRGDWDKRGYIHRRGSNSLASQNGHNFSLPRSMTIIDVNIDTFERKPWRHPGADITDFFNFGFNEDNWKKYCNRLDENRAQTIKVSSRPSSKPSRHYMDREVGSGSEVTHDAMAENIANSMQQQPELISGRAIHVQHCIFERRPSTDVRCPLDRDPDVIIQIAVQDTEEDCLISAKEVTDCSGFIQKAAKNEIDGSADEGRDISCSSSANEEEKLNLEEEGDGSGNSLPERRTPASGPLSVDSDNYGSVQYSNSGEHYEQDWTGLDGTIEAMEASDDTGESVGRKISNASPSVVEPESSNGRRHPHRPFYPTSDRFPQRSRNGADVRETHLQSKVASTGSELRESVTYDYHSSKDSKTHGVKTKYRKVDARSRIPMWDGPSYYRKRHIHKSELKNHMDDEDTSYFSDTDGFNNIGGSTVNHKRQRNDWHGFDSYGKQGNSCYEESQPFFDYENQELSNHNYRDDYAKSQHWKCISSFGCEMDQSHIQNINEKQYNFERRTSRVGHKLARKDFYHHQRRPVVHDIESLNYEESRLWTLESDCFIENVEGSRWKRRAEDRQYLKRDKNENILLESRIRRTLVPKKYREPMLNNDPNFLPHRYDNRLLYDKSEFESPRRSRWSCESPLNSFDNSWCEDLEGEKERCNSRHALSSGSFQRPLLVHRHKWLDAVSPKRGESHSRNWRNIWTERSNNKDWPTARLTAFNASVDTDEKMMHLGDQDDHVRKSQHGQCEILHKNLEKYNSVRWDDEFYSEGESYSFERVFGPRRFDTQHGSYHVRNLIDPQQVRWGRSKMKTERHSGSQCLQNSNFIRGETHVPTLPRFRDSVGLVNGKCNSRPTGKSFGAGNRYYDKYESMGCHSDLKQKIFKHSKRNFPENVARGENSKVDTKQKGGQWHHKFSDDQHNGSLDIEEGQVITEAGDEKAVQKVNSSEDTRQIGQKKNLLIVDSANADVASEAHENRRILEVIAKMEKRRERFKRPITLTNDVEKTSQNLADTVAEIPHSKPQRPARKRKWH